MQVTFTQDSLGVLWFTPGCYDDLIGKDIRLGAHSGTLVAAEIADDGTSAELTVDIPDDSPLAQRLRHPSTPRAAAYATILRAAGLPAEQVRRELGLP